MVPFLFQDPVKGPTLHGCVSSDSSDPWQFLRLYFYLSSMTLTLLENTNQVLIKCPSIWVFLLFSYDWIESLHFLAKYYRSGMSFLLHRIRGYVMLMCLLTGDVRLDDLVSMVSADFLHCRVTVFPFVTKIYLGGNILRLCKYPVFLHLLPTNFSSISSSCLK